MPANVENSAMATGLEKVSFHSNPKERQCQRMLKVLHYCTLSLICARVLFLSLCLVNKKVQVQNTVPLLPSILLFGKELGLDQCCIKQRPMKEEAPPNIRILSSPREMCFLTLRFLRRQNWVEATDLKPNLDWEARKRKLFSWA